MTYLQIRIGKKEKGMFTATVLKGTSGINVDLCYVFSLISIFYKMTMQMGAIANKKVPHTLFN